MNKLVLSFLSLRTWVRRPRFDGFVLALACVVLAATVLPCRGDSARAFQVAGLFAIGALFFLQGARLSRDTILHGMTHWRLHAAIGAMTYVLFPLLGAGLVATVPNLLPRRYFWVCFSFVCCHRPCSRRSP